MSGETFGAMLRRHRIKAGMSQNELARQAGCDPAYVNSLERGKAGKSGKLYRPSGGVVLGFAAALELSPAHTDRLLYAAGLATSTDWQARAERAERTLAMIRADLDGAASAIGTDEAAPTELRRRVG